MSHHAIVHGEDGGVVCQGVDNVFAVVDEHVWVGVVRTCTDGDPLVVRGEGEDVERGAGGVGWRWRRGTAIPRRDARIEGRFLRSSQESIVVIDCWRRVPWTG